MTVWNPDYGGAAAARIALLKMGCQVPQSDLTGVRRLPLGFTWAPRTTDGANKDGSACHWEASVACSVAHTAKPESAFCKADYL